MEHRCGHRREVNAAVTLRTRNGLADDGEVCNISASGALFRTPLTLPLHAHVLVQFPATHQDGRFRSPVVTAEVIRQVNDGFAVEWTEFSPASVRSVMRRLSQM